MARWLTRILLLRAVGFIFTVAFFVALQQNDFLLGDNGLSPVNAFLDRSYHDATSNAQRQRRGRGDSPMPSYPPRPMFHFGSTIEGLLRETVRSLPTALQSYLDPFLPPISARGNSARKELPLDLFKSIPTVFWFVDRSHLDYAMWLTAAGGVAVSLLVTITGRCPMLVMFALWVGYMSIVSVGQRWYSFGWESQLLETAFLTMWLCPFSFAKVPSYDAPPAVIYGFRWLIFRIMLGAGLIKLRGDECWRNLTCMEYHYLTQPIPNPFSIFFHNSPSWFHHFEVGVNHFVECAACFFVFLPQPAAALGGLIQLLFQVTLIASGNLSFLNWLTIVPALACFDDDHLRFFFAKSTVLEAKRGQQLSWRKLSLASRLRRLFRFLWQLGLVVGIGYLSIPVVSNLVSSNQAMNTSYDWLRIVNTYGAFGSITKERNEVIVEGWHPKKEKWVEYDFLCKPGNVTRRPCWISPLHLRLDWLMWFAAFQSWQQNPWLLHLSWKLLHSDDAKNERWIQHMMGPNQQFAKPQLSGSSASSSSNSGSTFEPPTKIRMMLYNYQYADLKQIQQWFVQWGGYQLKRSGLADLLLSENTLRTLPVEYPSPPKWWRRRKVKEYMPEMTKADLDQYRAYFHF